MWRNQLSLVGMVLLTLVGCSSESPPPEATAPSPNSTVASPAPTTAPRAVPSSTAQPLIAQRPPSPAIPGLIPSTNAQERGKQVGTEIRTGTPNDPFSALPPELSKAGTTKSVPQVTRLPGGNSPNGSSESKSPADVGVPTIPKIQGAPLGVKLPPVMPPPIPQTFAPNSNGRSLPTGSKPVLPPPPSTDTAKAVEVTGVVLVGQRPQAIVVAPGDATSRYVSTGQRISGGKVLVKRIEFPNGSEPVVILEENGVEVAKSVGEKPPQAIDKPSA